MDIQNIYKQFKFEGTLVNYSKYGSGHINKTYVLSFKITDFYYRRYIIQKINNNVFKDVEALMSNVSKVIDFSHQKILKEKGNPFLESLTLVRTIDNKCFYKTPEGEYYRAYYFIEEGNGYDMTEDPKNFYESGVVFGHFQKLMSTFKVDELYEVIKDFHNTEVRLQNLEKAIEENIVGRKESAIKEITFYLSRKSYASKVVNMLSSGEIPYRVTHNDTKLNNILINPITNKAVCILDYDTIMPGSVLYDFGDSIRFGASTAKEDEKDLNLVNFNIDLFKLYTKGFLKETKDILTEKEKENLAFSAILITYECGMRFLTDHLNGDTYFGAKYPNHNLIRCRTQMKLVAEMEKVLDKMNAIVKKYS